MTTITEVATDIIGLVTTGKEIYQFVVSAMDSLELVSAEKSGGDKKAIILSVVQMFVENAGQVWSDWSALVSKFIDLIKATYNASVNLINSFKSTASV